MFSNKTWLVYLIVKLHNMALEDTFEVDQLRCKVINTINAKLSSFFSRMVRPHLTMLQVINIQTLCSCLLIIVLILIFGTRLVFWWNFTIAASRDRQHIPSFFIFLSILYIPTHLFKGILKWLLKSYSWRMIPTLPNPTK